MTILTIREAISQALWEEMERDQRVIILGEEVGVWGGTYAVTKGFYDHFGPERVLDTPIAEGTIVGAANGAAMAGLRPVAELMTITSGRNASSTRPSPKGRSSAPPTAPPWPGCGRWPN